MRFLFAILFFNSFFSLVAQNAIFTRKNYNSIYSNYEKNSLKCVNDSNCMLLANMHFNLQKFNISLEEYSSAYTYSDSLNLSALEGIGMSYYYLDNKIVAKKILKEVYDRDSFYKGYFLILADENFADFQYEKAIQMYTYSIDYDVYKFSSYYNRASCYIESGNYEKAILDIEILKTIDPNNPSVQAIFDKAVGLKKMKQFTKIFFWIFLGVLAIVLVFFVVKINERNQDYLGD